MKANNVLGIIFSNMHDDKIGEMTATRTMGSIPFGGRYRLIDFPLSNMVHSEIKTVGVITKSNYQSLMDHLGSGKAWDLSRKRDGLFILPPFGHGNSVYRTRIEALNGIMSFLKGAKQDYVVLSDCNIVATMDFSDIISFHKEKNADITVVYKNMERPDNGAESLVLSCIGKNGRIKELLISPETEGKHPCAVNIFVAGREFLIKQISDCVSRNKESFLRDVLQSNVNDFKFFGYKFDGYLRLITSMNSYYQANMELQQAEVRKALFNSAPVYTKIRDAMPALYSYDSKVENSLIADGCVIDGKVENSIIFRNVKIGRHSIIRNSIIMQGTEIGENCDISYAILDKDVIMGDDRRIFALENSLHYIGKGTNL